MRKSNRILFELYLLPRGEKAGASSSLQCHVILYEIPKHYREVTFRRAIEKLIEYFPEKEFSIKHAMSGRISQFKFKDIDHVDLLNYQRKKVESTTFNGNSLFLQEMEHDAILSIMDELENRRLSSALNK